MYHNGNVQKGYLNPKDGMSQIDGQAAHVAVLEEMEKKATILGGMQVKMCEHEHTKSEWATIENQCTQANTWAHADVTAYTQAQSVHTVYVKINTFSLNT